MPDLDFHPLANLFPLIEGAEFDDLVADVRANGLREAVVLFQGKVLDGRNRYRACVAAEVEPQLVYFRPEIEGEPLSFVISKNLKRRHLNESQRAMVAAAIANMRQGARNDVEPSANLRKVDQPAAAKMLNISERSLQSAKAVREKGTPALVRAVEQGKLAVSEAAKATKLAPAEQEKIAALAEEGRANVARTVIKQEAREQREAELGIRQAAGNLALPQKRYGVILADPEWQFEPWSRKTGLDRAADNHYPTSVTAVIAARPVVDIAADDCVLFLWATVPMLPHALLVMAAWDFDYRTHFAWAKDRAGTGYWNRNCHELLLLGVRGHVPAPAPGTQWHSLIEAAVGEHSEKPESFYAMIEAYFPTLPKVELNARRARAGWQPWGLDAPIEDSCGESRERETSDTPPVEAMPDSKPEAPPLEQPKGTIGNSGTYDDGLEIPAFLKRSKPEVPHA